MQNYSEEARFTLGKDYGSDSVRAPIVNTINGDEAAVKVSHYPRRKRGSFRVPKATQFRQHPQNYIDRMVDAVRQALSGTSCSEAGRIAGIALDTNGTPVAVGAVGIPLDMLLEFLEPNGTLVLWNDHTAIQEAEQINELCQRWTTDYTKYEGGGYSAEWFWARLLHVRRTVAPDPAVVPVYDQVYAHCQALGKAAEKLAC